MSLLAQLRSAITASGLSVRALARVSGVDEKAVRDIIAGEHSIDLDAFNRLAGHFGIPAAATIEAIWPPPTPREPGKELFITRAGREPASKAMSRLALERAGLPVPDYLLPSGSGISPAEEKRQRKLEEQEAAKIAARRREQKADARESRQDRQT